MKDEEDMIKFVKIVEKYPIIYDSSKECYRMRYALENAWKEVANIVKKDISEEYSGDNLYPTVEELKVKWKGIRSSFNRFKGKLYQTNIEDLPCKKYYLYDSLRFLDPFTKPKGIPEKNVILSKPSVHEYNNYHVDVDDNSSAEYTNTFQEWQTRDIKPDFTQEINEMDSSDSEQHYKHDMELKKSKYDSKEATKRKIDDDEDLQFFRSILPDIRNWSSKEKRKFKMGILKLIDEIDDERKRCESSNEVTST